MSTAYSTYSSVGTMITVMACFVCSTAMRLLPAPPSLKDFPLSLKNPPLRKAVSLILLPDYSVQNNAPQANDNDGSMSAIRDSSRWIASVQDAAYLRPAVKKGLIPITAKDDKISFLGGNDLECTLLEGLDANAKVALDAAGGAFISFKFSSSLPQHDAVIGRVSSNAKLLAHSRIKRYDNGPSSTQI